VTSVNGATGAVNLYADDATLNLAGDGIVVSGTGATSTLDVDSGTTANKIVKLDGSARLPAVDGSQLTNLPAAPVTSVNGATGVVNIYADDSTLNIDGTGLVLSGTGATSTLNADVGTGANQIVQLDGSSRLPAVDGSQLTNLPSAPVTSVNGRTGAVIGLLENVAEDTTPQLGGPLDVNGQAIVSASAGNIAITPDTTGSIVLDGLSWPQADGSADQVLKTNGAGQLSFVDQSGGGSRPTVTTDNSGTNTTISDPAASVLEDIYLIDNGSTAVTITLPTVTNNAGYKAQIKRLGTASVTVSPASGTIDGASSKVINAQYGALTCCTDGTNWFII